MSKTSSRGPGSVGVLESPQSRGPGSVGMLESPQSFTGYIKIRFLNMDE